MKRYTFELIINEGNDEFWEEIKDSGKSGCDDIKEAIEQSLLHFGWDVGKSCSLTLTGFAEVK